MGDTGIRWTQKTWNPVSGCRKISDGCTNCYAFTLAERMRGSLAFPVGFDPVMKPGKLHEPASWKQPAHVFVNSMSDLFLGDWPTEYIDQVFDTMLKTDRHVYQILTKRPRRMRDYLCGIHPALRIRTDPSEGYLARRGLLKLPEHIWPGVTIENNLMTFRADVLREIPSDYRFISAEPLLSPLASLSLDGIAWLIAGGESGNHMTKSPERWMQLDWARDLRDRCVAQGVAYFYKQSSGVRTEMGQLLDGERWEQVPVLPRERVLL